MEAGISQTAVTWVMSGLEARPRFITRSSWRCHFLIPTLKDPVTSSRKRRFFSVEKITGRHLTHGHQNRWNSKTFTSMQRVNYLLRNQKWRNLQPHTGAIPLSQFHTLT